MPTDPLTLPKSERDRMAAIHVMEWTLVDGRYYQNGVVQCGEQYWFCQDGPCDDDYLILRKVRETWSVDDRIAFGAALDAEIWAARERIDSMGMLDYEPGDYRDSSLIVLAEKGII